MNFFSDLIHLVRFWRFRVFELASFECFYAQFCYFFGFFGYILGFECFFFLGFFLMNSFVIPIVLDLNICFYCFGCVWFCGKFVKICLIREKKLVLGPNWYCTYNMLSNCVQ